MTLRCLFVDFNSYFASVEQQDDPSLRGRPVGVVPVMAESTCCIAASVEAKRFGVRTGTLVREARELCPDLVIVPARPARYVELHHAALAALEENFPVNDVHVGSIDEMACDLVGSRRQRERAVALASSVKASLREHVGGWIRCSVGIGPNRFLAKTASDMQKPDGLVVLEQDTLPQALFGLELQDLCGIGPAMHERLLAHGIHTVEQLCLSPAHRLRHVWGGIEGERFHARLHGAELPEAPTRRASIGHSHVLAPEFRSTAGADAVLKKLLQKAAMRLREAKLLAGLMQVKVKYVGEEPWEAAVEFDHDDDSRLLMRLLTRLLAQRRDRRPVLAVGVSLHRLVARGLASGLLFGQADHAEAQALNGVVDRINRKYGLNKIYFGGAQDALAAAPMRISFNRIPEAGLEQEAGKNELWLQRLNQARVLAEAAHRRREAGGR